MSIFVKFLSFIFIIFEYREEKYNVYFWKGYNCVYYVLLKCFLLYVRFILFLRVVNFSNNNNYYW